MCSDWQSIVSLLQTNFHYVTKKLSTRYGTQVFVVDYMLGTVPFNKRDSRCSGWETAALNK